LKIINNKKSIKLNDFLKELSICCDKTNSHLRRLLPPKSEEKLYDAINYSIFSGGKRFRAFLVIQAAKLYEIPVVRALQAASAIEIIHTYSLVHDDLPSMDNDDFRRGKPTIHIKWDEATAVLVGDALQAFAYQILSFEETHPKSEVRLNLIRTLSEASGLKGMVLGQSKDLEAEKNNKSLELKDIISLQKLKTGALFNWSLKSANILAEKNHASLEKYANSIGLAFQIKDDLLDHEGTMEKTGKKVGKDNAAGKATLVSLLGVENAKKRCVELCEEACDSLDYFGTKSEILKTAARFTIERGF
jgi:farnesyl diphosphate synthase